MPAFEDYSIDIGQLVEWKGWHAYRRGLATNRPRCRLVQSCGVRAKVTQAILRHSSVTLTLDIYTQTPDADSRAALAKIEEWLKVV
jgi:integrase